MTRLSKKTGRPRHRRSYTLIRKGIRGKYAMPYRSATNLVLLAPDVATVFPTAESVNDALRLLIKVAGSMRTTPAK